MAFVASSFVAVVDRPFPGRPYNYYPRVDKDVVEDNHQVVQDNRDWVWWDVDYCCCCNFALDRKDGVLDRVEDTVVSWDYDCVRHLRLAIAEFVASPFLPDPFDSCENCRSCEN